MAYHKPPPVTKVNNVYPDQMRELLFGVSVITQRCDACQWVTTERVCGKAVVPGFNQ